MEQTNVEQLTLPYPLTEYQAKLIHLESRYLEGNPLGDPHWRQNYCLVPLDESKKYPVVFHLSGYFSTGYQVFSSRTLEKNIPQWIDQDTREGSLKPAIHVFVEATTYWGGSQFINSPGCGDYSKYILKELVPMVDKSFNCNKSWSVVGGSSGGYGALQLISHKGSLFSQALAIAPDSFFQASLLPELFQMAPQLAEYKNIAAIKKLIVNDEIQQKRHFFPMMNVIAMAHCYSPARSFRKDNIQWPVNLKTGRVDSALWKSWLTHDPVEFIGKRGSALKGKKIYLDVGKYDNYSLQFGTRQIAESLKKMRVAFSLSEFSGTHRGLSQRRRALLSNLF